MGGDELPLAPTADEQPGATPATIEFASRWRAMPKVVFSSTVSTRTFPGGVVLTRYETRR